jgi:hypothetical protein
MADPKFVDMKFTKAEAKAEAKEMTSAKPPDYPWGLAIRLEKEELDKLGIKTLPQIGSEVHFAAVAMVTGINHSARQGQDEETCLALQITMLSVVKVESAEEEKGERETPAAEAKETPSLLRSY